MKVICAKGCGVEIEVTPEMVQEALKFGTGFDVAHDICPRDAEHQPKYVLVQTLERYEPKLDGLGGHMDEPTVLAQTKGTVIGTSYGDVKEALIGDLNFNWGRIENLIAGAEGDLNVSVLPKQEGEEGEELDADKDDQNPQ